MYVVVVFRFAVCFEMFWNGEWGDVYWSKGNVGFRSGGVGEFAVVYWKSFLVLLNIDFIKCVYRI